MSTIESAAQRVIEVIDNATLRRVPGVEWRQLQAAVAPLRSLLGAQAGGTQPTAAGAMAELEQHVLLYSKPTSEAAWALGVVREHIRALETRLALVQAHHEIAFRDPIPNAVKEG